MTTATLSRSRRLRPRPLYLPPNPDRQAGIAPADPASQDDPLPNDAVATAILQAETEEAAALVRQDFQLAAKQELARLAAQARTARGQARSAAWERFATRRRQLVDQGLITEAPELSTEQRRQLLAQGIRQFRSLSLARKVASHLIREEARYVVVAKHPERGDWWLFADQHPHNPDTEVEVVRRGKSGQLPEITSRPYRHGDLIRKRFTVTYRDPATGDLAEVTVRAFTAIGAERLVLDEAPNVQVIDAQEWACDWEEDDFPADSTITRLSEDGPADEYEALADILD